MNAPQIQTVTRDGEFRVSVTWDALSLEPENGGSDITSYSLEQSLNDEDWEALSGVDQDSLQTR